MQINKIVIHCSDTPTGRDVSAEEIHGWHKDGNGWDGIGYHAVIRVNGAIEQGRPDYWPGAHVAGHNGDSIAVCMIGNGDFNVAQRISLLHYLKEKLTMYPDAKVVGHYQLDSKKPHCPGFDVPEFLKSHQLGEVSL